MRTIKKAIKNSKKINKDFIKSPQLLQSKSYLKILGLLYFSENTNESITSQLVEEVLKELHIFKDVKFSSKPQVIKASPNSDLAIIWIDIWNSQSGSKAKSIINCHFNISRFIATIHSTSVSLGVPQCKNCCKWGHSSLRC